MIILILVFRIGSVLNQNFHHLRTVDVAGVRDGKVQSRLPEAQLESREDVVIILPEKLPNLVDLTLIFG